MNEPRSLGRLIIAGGRKLNIPTTAVVEWLNDLAEAHGEPTIVLSGECRGADKIGSLWARCRGVQVHSYPADWSLHGRSAGPIRNRKMAEEADAVALLPGGAGTANMLRIALQLGLAVYFYPNLNQYRGKP